MNIATYQTTEECITMGQSQNGSLKQNPFTTYRDPVTGRWSVVHPDAHELDEKRGKPKEPTLTVLDGGIQTKRSPHGRAIANLNTDAMP